MVDHIHFCWPLNLIQFLIFTGTDTYRVSAFSIVSPHFHLTCQLTSATVFLFAVLIDAIVRNGDTAAPQANHVPPPTGWADEDIRSNETSNVGGEEKKSYTEEQRQGVLR